jgi:hypothetical protein
LQTIIQRELYLGDSQKKRGNKVGNITNYQPATIVVEATQALASILLDD